jgi:CRISPR-associated protein Cas2
MVAEEGKVLEEVLKDFTKFIKNLSLVGYDIGFVLQFLNENFKQCNLDVLENKAYSLIKYIKREKMSLKDYKLRTVLVEYDITDKVTDRALEDAKLIYDLSTKVNKFLKVIN